MKKFLLAILASAAAFAAPASASEAQLGLIYNIYAMNSGAVLFSSSGPRTTPPSCQGPGLNARFAIDASTPAGQSAVAVLLNAHARGKRVFVVGSGNCTIWGDTETIWFFTIED